MKGALINLINALVLIVVFTSLKIFANEPIVITILADDDYPPYSFMEHGELQGAYIDLVRQASTLVKPKYQVNLKGVPWKRALMLIEQGKAFAVLPPYLHLKARKFINPYSVALSKEVVVTYCLDNIRLEEILKQPNKNKSSINIGINSGYILLDKKYYQAINRGNIEIRENKSTEANLMKLLTKKIECYVSDRLSIISTLKKIKNEIKHLDTSTVKEMDIISQKTAHIGYSSSNIYPYKADFVHMMNQAIENVKNSQPSTP